MTEQPGKPDALPISTIVGILMAGIAVLVLGLWLGRDGIGGEPQIPTIALEAPSAGAVVDSPLVVRFRTSRLLKAPEGWRSGRMHLHADVDGVEVMPAAADIQRLDDGSYAWALPLLAPGQHRLRLRWSDPQHQPVEEGATEEIVFRVAGAASPSGVPGAPADGPGGAGADPILSDTAADAHAGHR